MMKSIKKCLSGLILTFMLVMAMSVVGSAATYYVTNKTVNMRRSNTTSSTVVMTLPENTVVRYISHEGGWYKVKYQANSQQVYTGFVSGWYISKADVYTTAKANNMRSRNTRYSSLVKKIPKGATIIVRDSYTGTYYKSEYYANGKVYRGFVRQDFLRKVGATTGNYKTTTAVYMHTNPIMESGVVCVVPANRTVKVLNINNGKWYKCTYTSGKKTYTGYISNRCLTR